MIDNLLARETLCWHRTSSRPTTQRDILCTSQSLPSKTETKCICSRQALTFPEIFAVLRGIRAPWERVQAREIESPPPATCSSTRTAPVHLSGHRGKES